MEKPSKIEDTMRAYLKRTKNFIYKFRTERKISDYSSLDLREFVGWLIHKKQEWSRPTWRQYKSAVVYYLESQDDPVAQEALEMLLPIEVDGCVKKTQKTSGSKLKRFPLKDYQKICDLLEGSDNRWAIPLKRWIMCSLIVGLRPKEWGQCFVTQIDNEPALVVKNAKHTNGRAHGETRTILLGMLDANEINMIKEHAEKSAEWFSAGQFKEYYEGCSATLSRLCRQQWPNRSHHITLYSARHQFSANAKSSGLTKEEIAALMGHAVDDTATIHYGRKVAGYDLLRVRPYPPDVQKVKPSDKTNIRIEPTPIVQPHMKLVPPNTEQKK